MGREYLRSKIHGARVTQTEKDYDGSITIDADILETADIAVHEKVLVVNIDSGNRFETYTIPGEAGEMCINGAAARLAEVGDEVIVMSFERLAGDREPDPTIIKLNGENEVIGDLSDDTGPSAGDKG